MKMRRLRNAQTSVGFMREQMANCTAADGDDNDDFVLVLVSVNGSRHASNG